MCLFPHLGDPCRFYKVRQFKGYFVDSSLILQVSSFLIPMTRYWHRVPHLLQFHQKQWISRCCIPSFHHVWSLDLHLKIKDFHALHHLSLFLRHLLVIALLIIVIFIVLCRLLKHILCIIFLTCFVFLCLSRFVSCCRCREVIKDVFELCNMLYNQLLATNNCAYPTRCKYTFLFLKTHVFKLDIFQIVIINIHFAILGHSIL